MMEIERRIESGIYYKSESEAEMRRVEMIAKELGVEARNLN